jgi:signal transduction histidine kinase
VSSGDLVALANTSSPGFIKGLGSKLNDFTDTYRQAKTDTRQMIKSISNTGSEVRGDVGALASLFATLTGGAFLASSAFSGMIPIDRPQ